MLYSERHKRDIRAFPTDVVIVSSMGRIMRRSSGRRFREVSH